MNKRTIISLLIVMGLGSNPMFGQNPIIQTIFTADPAPMVHNDTAYRYTTHAEDVLVNSFFTMNDWRSYLSTDRVTQKTSGIAIGVAVSLSPTGPFKNALEKHLLIGNRYIDPTVFIDHGQAYLYGGNSELCYVKLNQDIISYNQQSGNTEARS